MNEIKVVELFAGVGGFRVGLEQSSPAFKTIWANQWEPVKKQQHAFDCYTSHFGRSENHVNADISTVKKQIPSHNLLVGGFPCQDYSVAQSCAKGIEGKKGVLWWEIHDIIKQHTPPFVLLENVDRLIKSPANQRGRDFAIMLRCFNDLGYAVEWRIINAAEYGYAQRRRRIFIFAYHNKTSIFEQLSRFTSAQGYFEWIQEKGFFAPAFPVLEKRNPHKCTTADIHEKYYPTLQNISNSFSTYFYNSGIMHEGRIFSEELCPIEKAPITLRDIRLSGEVDQKYFLNGNLEKWEFLKGAKRIPRVRPNGVPYVFSEGGMCFPDDIDKPARTMLTSESNVNRSTHVIEDAMTGGLRLLTPIECERINGFDDNWTNTGMPEKFRYFTMGNALVVPVVRQIGNRILEIL